tara:strand:+ start:46 stop:1935 length:1890 start_codon:yes stop_codon:yes gene_type:complete
MAIQKTTPGSYEAPVYGIIDYSGFSKGLEEGAAPGLLFLKEKEEEEEEKQKEREGIKIDDILAKGGELYGNTFNPNKIIQEDYRREAERIRSLILDTSTSDSDVKLLKRQHENLAAVNSSLGVLIDIDNDPKLYNKNASDLDSLFTSQNSSLEEFRDAYNSGRARPTVKIIDGISVGGFEIEVNGEKKFLDFQNKINENTIKGNVELRADERLKADAIEFGKAQGKTVTETDSWFNAAGDTVKRTKLFEQAVASKLEESRVASVNYVSQNEELKPGIFSDLLLDETFLTEEDRTFIKQTGGKYNKFNKESVKQIMANISETRAENGAEPMSNQDLEIQANNFIKSKRDEIIVKYVNNELLKNTSDFYTANENETMPDGSVRRKGIAYPMDDMYQSTEAKPEPPTGGGSGGRKQTGNVKGRLFNISSNLNSSVYNYATPGSTNYLKEDGSKTIDLKGLGEGFITDTDGTKAAIKKGSVIREGNRMFLELTYEAGKEENNEKFPLGTIVDGEKGPEFRTDFDGRKILTERIYRGQFGASTVDQAKDLLSGEQNIYKDRTKVQKYFFQAGKDETMFRRLDIIRKFEENPDDPTVFDNLTEDDKKQLGRARSEETIGYKFQQAYIKSKNPLLN